MSGIRNCSGRRFRRAAQLGGALAGAVVIGSTLPQHSWAQAPARQAPQIRIDYTEETLPSGLKVIYSIDRSTPVAAVEVMYNVGSKHEQEGRTGFAHLFEHVMFKGSRNIGDGEHFALLEKAGARGGADINGTTWTDRTNYFEQVPSNYLELALWMEADRMGTLLEVLTPEKLDNQREVVKNERRQSVDNQPYGTWLEKAQGYVFPKGHPYNHSVIGSMEDLSAASLEDVRQFFRTYYAPNNAVLVIAGDFDLENAKALVRKHFGWIPKGPAAPPLRSLDVPPVIGQPQREVVQDANAPAPAVYVAYRMPPQRSEKAAAVSLLGAVLASGRSSPFYKSLVREKEIAVNVGGFNLGLIDGADMLVVTARGKATTNPDSLEQALLAELASAASKIDQEMLDRTRAGARSMIVDQLQTTGGFGGRADQLAEAWTYYRNPNRVNTLLAELDAVTLADLRALASERIVPQNRVVLVYVPAAKPASTTGNN